MSDVRSLLNESRAAHMRYRTAASKVKGAGRADLQIASDKRKEAIALDPDRRDSAWAEEDKHTTTGVNTHDALTDFYAGKLGA